MLTSKEIRQSFIDFFASKNHKIVSSAPMVIKDDPTLMFTNAGMNQFKNIILGNDPIKYPRVADSQKCLRVSGKHNDLEEVGHDTYHHTMFEMLGNWSFGDYFKKEAIGWAWEFLTEVLGLDKNRLYVTVFEGSIEDNLERDNEAAGYWKQFLPENRIFNGNKKDNFWEMGDTGPCGPCSEVHIDIRPDKERAEIDGFTLVNQSHPQVIEIWNLVFMQFNRKSDGSLEGLPNKVIDTGMGFERLCMALQGKLSNYDTDIFQPIIKEIEKITNVSLHSTHGETEIVAMRVIADHIRTIAFSIADGQLPSNAKAGYVIRRILRRAVRYGYTFLAQRQSFMYKLIPVLCEVMGSAYPELIAQKSLIEKVIKEEEEAFLRTLETGIKLLDKQLAENTNENILSGKIAFELYDTYGFPLDLTELILRENGKVVNIEEFSSEMKKQRERARNAASVETGDWIIVNDGETEFVGYDANKVETKILRYRNVKQKNDEFYQIVLEKTPFYAEMGGQVGDCGWLYSSSETDVAEVEIVDTKKENNLSVHISKTLPKDVNQKFLAKINIEKRNATARNHSATHILHEALREVLGKHVEQKGSYVSPESLRFDFSHFQKMTQQEIRQVEHIANKRVRENLHRDEVRNMSIAEAQQMGAMALFGEKYGETVRIIKFGNSVELCGGTHVHSTGEIGMVRIISESSIAAGIRRIEAITGEMVEKVLDEFQDFANSAREFLNNAPDLRVAIRKIVEENADLKKRVEVFVMQNLAEFSEKLLSQSVEKDGIKIVKYTADIPAEQAKILAFQIRNRQNEKLKVVIGSVFDGKPSLTVLLSDDLVAAGMNAVQIIRQAAKEIEGGGGGQAFFAQAGGKNSQGLEKAVDKATLTINN
ncbi:MAG: alanine--tRNA ligase [Prevotellaceae bacterium]|jgi:alanyl-tRNA synthetase|nr:alanine--tRNA ligase [Prevotellaceae bacterium]